MLSDKLERFLCGKYYQDSLPIIFQVKLELTQVEHLLNLKVGSINFKPLLD
jgi:hypothetical protein